MYDSLQQKSLQVVISKGADNNSAECDSIDETYPDKPQGQDGIQKVKPSLGYSDADVPQLNCEQFTEWLRKKDFDLDDCQCFRGNDILLQYSYQK